MIDLNCKALLRMTRLTLPYMGRGSHILQLDSLSAFQPVPYITTYGATKAFVLSYSRAMNRELQPQGIRSGVGQNRIFPPCLPHQRGQGAVF